MKKQFDVSPLVLAAAASLLLGSLAATSPAAAQLGCDEIEFGEDIRTRYPDIQQACLGVLERDGERYVRLEAKVVKAGSRRLTIRYKHADGKWGKSFRTNELPRDFRINIAGEQTRPRDLARNQDLEIYVKVGGQIAALIVEDDDRDVVPDTTPVSVAMAPAVLPSTGSALPLLGLAGVLSIAAGAGLTWRRRRVGAPRA